MHKFFIIEIDSHIRTIMTYEMIEQEYLIKREQFKKDVKNLISSGYIKSFYECETDSIELYKAILDKDIPAINELLSKNE